MIQAAGQLGESVSVAVACRALGVPRAAFNRQRASEPVRDRGSSRPSPRSLSSEERQAVVDQLHSNRFADQAPAQVFATLLDEGTYLCSIRTMYRILDDHSEVGERRNQLRHPQYAKPELLATAPNQVWSWDITKLLGPVKWSYFYLYVILDIYSRYVVGWLIADCESAVLAEQLIQETLDKQRIRPGQLVIHADRGSSMRSRTVALLLADLGVTKTHSRPHTSDDNPYSEAQFKTLKYRPDFPARFGSLPDARAFGRAFFRWYNQEHRHSGIGLLTPEAVHYGRAASIVERRSNVLRAACQAHPERFVNGPPRPPEVPQAAWINKPVHAEVAADRVP